MLTPRNDLSCWQKAEEWELLRGNRGTKNTEESRTKEDTESPCSQGRNGDIKQFFSYCHQQLEAEHCSPPHRMGGVKGQQQEDLCVLVPGHEHTHVCCVGGEDS